MKDLNTASKTEVEQFLNSFDRVLCDVDGVLWLHLETIPGTQDAIRCLGELGKQIIYVSNNTTKTLDVYRNQLETAGFDVENNELVTPVPAMISHLQKLNFSKEICVIGTDALKSSLKAEGFKIAADPPIRLEENIKEFVAIGTAGDENVGAVIADGDINTTYLKLQKAATHLKRPEVIFILGANDKKLPIGSNHVLLGPGYFQEILEDVSGRKAYGLAKPSVHFNEYIVERFGIKDTSRVLFVGDSIAEDMGFATNSGYRKLLVLSGLSKIDAIKNWTFPDEYKPDYYVDSLKTLHDLIVKHALQRCP